jgi:hypothetical protein
VDTAVLQLALPGADAAALKVLGQSGNFQRTSRATTAGGVKVAQHPGDKIGVPTWLTTMA